MRRSRADERSHRRASLVRATYCLLFQGCSACFPHEGGQSGCFADDQPSGCNLTFRTTGTGFGAEGGSNSAGTATETNTATTGFPEATLGLTVGPPGFVYADSPKGIPIHITPGVGLTGAVTVTVVAPPNTVSSPTLVLPNGTNDALLTLSSIPGTSTAIVAISVHASNPGVANDATAPLNAVIAGPSGSLDGTFAGNGFRSFPADPMATAESNGILTTATGDVAIGGDEGPVTLRSTFLAEFDTTGTLIGGMPATVSWPSDNTAFGIVADTSGRVLAAGNAPLAGAQAPTLYRFAPMTPTLDVRFGAGGTVQHLPAGASAGGYRGVTTLPDGRIATVGTLVEGAPNGSAILSLVSADGMSTSDFALAAPAASANAAALDPDMQHLFLAGDAAPPTPGIFLTRFDVATSTFGFASGLGTAVFSQPGAMFAHGNGIAARLDGNGDAVGYVVAGTTGVDATTAGMIATAFTTDGALDTSFGSGSGTVSPLPPLPMCRPWSSTRAVARSSSGRQVRRARRRSYASPRPVLSTRRRSTSHRSRQGAPMRSRSINTGGFSSPVASTWAARGTRSLRATGRSYRRSTRVSLFARPCAGLLPVETPVSRNAATTPAMADGGGKPASPRAAVNADADW